MSVPPTDTTASSFWLLGPAVLPGGLHPDAAIAITGDRIRWAGPRPDAGHLPSGPITSMTPSAPIIRIGPDQLLAPGYVDVHCHGGGGAGFGASVADSSTAAEFHHRSGTTSVVASLVADRTDALTGAAETCGRLTASGQLVGVHMEGPFLSAARRGAHDLRYLREIDLELVDVLDRAAAGATVAMTYAPELPNSHRLVDALLDKGILPAVGHTDADFATVADALGRAASRGRRALVTHLFNAMAPWQSRSPGPVAAALSAAARGSAVVELIADGVHLHDATVTSTFAVAERGCVVLVSDAVAAAGAPDGHYPLGPRRMVVHGGVARMESSDPAGGPLAGGMAPLAEIVRQCVGAGIDVARAIAAATSTPAALLGLHEQLGSLASGLRADVLVLDASLVPAHVLRGGQWLDSPPRPVS